MTESTSSTTPIPIPIPARRPGSQAEVGDIVISLWSSSGALWKVDAVREQPAFRMSTRKVLELTSVTSKRHDSRGAGDMQIVSPEEVAKILAKRNRPTPEQTLESVADVIARWDYKTATGEEPDSDESVVLPPHREIAAKVIAIATGVAA